MRRCSLTTSYITKRSRTGLLIAKEGARRRTSCLLRLPVDFSRCKTSQWHIFWLRRFSALNFQPLKLLQLVAQCTAWPAMRHPPLWIAGAWGEPLCTAQGQGSTSDSSRWVIAIMAGERPSNLGPMIMIMQHRDM